MTSEIVSFQPHLGNFEEQVEAVQLHAGDARVVAFVTDRASEVLVANGNQWHEQISELRDTLAAMEARDQSADMLRSDLWMKIQTTGANITRVLDTERSCFDRITMTNQLIAAKDQEYTAATVRHDQIEKKEVPELRKAIRERAQRIETHRAEFDGFASKEHTEDEQNELLGYADEMGAEEREEAKLEAEHRKLADELLELTAREEEIPLEIRAAKDFIVRMRSEAAACRLSYRELKEQLVTLWRMAAAIDVPTGKTAEPQQSSTSQPEAAPFEIPQETQTIDNLSETESTVILMRPRITGERAAMLMTVASMTSEPAEETVQPAPRTASRPQEPKPQHVSVHHSAPRLVQRLGIGEGRKQA